MRKSILKFKASSLVMQMKIDWELKRRFWKNGKQMQRGWSWRLSSGWTLSQTEGSGLFDTRYLTEWHGNRWRRESDGKLLERVLDRNTTDLWKKNKVYPFCPFCPFWICYSINWTKWQQIRLTLIVPP